MHQWFKDIPKYSKKTDSVRSNICSSGSRTYRNIARRPIQSGVTYAPVVQGHTEIPQTNVTQLNPTNMTQLANGLTELKQKKDNLMNQKGTLINLISALVNKNN